MSDGDTLTVLDIERRQHKVRLAGIDAPEKGQPFGRASKQYLSELAYGETVLVDWEKLDRYGRIIGKVTVAGVDVCIAQVRAGLAWHYVKYAAEQPAHDRHDYAAAQADAQAARRGLWRDAQPLAPWEWRSAIRLGNGRMF